MNVKDFQIIKQGAVSPVATSDAVISTAAGELVARLCDICMLQEDQVYELRINVGTPNLARPEDVMWSFEIWDDNDLLPLNTNDMLTESFRLVDKIQVSLQATRSPPL